MNCTILVPDLTVAEVLSRWPQTIPVFNHYHTACVGCPMAPYDTLADVVHIYRLPQDSFLHALEKAIWNDAPSEEAYDGDR